MPPNDKHIRKFMANTVFEIMKKDERVIFENKSETFWRSNTDFKDNFSQPQTYRDK